MIKHPISYLWRELAQMMAIALIAIALGIVALRVATPYVAKQLPNLRYWAEFQLQHPLEVGHLSLIWQGPRPALRLSNVQLLDEARKNTLVSAQEITITINPLDSLINGKFHLGRVSIQGAQLHIGPMPITDIGPGFLGVLERIDSPLGNEQKHWIELFESFPIQEWVLTDSYINLLDNEGKFWPLTQVDAVLRRQGTALKLRSRLSLARMDGAQLRIQGDIEEAFTAPRGTLFFEGKSLTLERLAQWIPMEWLPYLPAGQVAFAIWADIDANTNLSELKCKLEATELRAIVNQSTPPDSFMGNIWWIRKEAGPWQVFGHDFHLDKADSKGLPAAFELSGTTSGYGLRAKNVALDNWLPFFLNAHWLPSTTHQFLAQYQPVGAIDYLETSYRPDVATPWVEVWAQGSNMGLTFPTLGHQFQGLNLELSADPRSGMLAMQGSVLTYAPLRQPEYRRRLENFEGNLTWIASPIGWRIQGLGHQLDLQDRAAHVQAAYHLALSPKGEPQSIGLMAAMDKIALTDIAGKMPGVYAQPELAVWLQSALQGGSLEGLSFIYRDNFQKNTAPVIQGQGKITDARLNYFAPWPILKDIQGQLGLKGNSLQIQLKQGNLGPELPVTASALISDLTASVPVLIVDSHVGGDLASLPAVLKDSEIGPSVGQTLQRFRAEGPFDLGLTLQVPLSEAPVHLRGLLALKNDSMYLDFWQPIPLTQIHGEIQFSEKNLSSRTLGAFWKEEPIVATMQANFEDMKAGSLDLIAHSQIRAGFLKHWLDFPLLPIHGQTPYTVEVNVPLGDAGYAGHVAVYSELEGIDVDLPPPFFKQADTKRKYLLDLYLEENDRIGVRMQYGSAISWAQRFQKQGQAWQGSQGHLHFGAGALAGFQEKYPFLIDGELEQLCIADWVGLSKRFNPPPKKSKSKLLPEKSPAASPIFDPQVDLQLGVLDAWGWLFPETRLKLQHDHGYWAINTEGPSIAGKILLPVEPQANKAILLDMQHIRIPSMPVQSTPLNMQDMGVLAPIRFRSTRVDWADHTLEQVFLKLTPKKTGYAIERFHSEGKDFRAALAGYWGFKESNAPFHVEGTLYARDIGKIMRALDQPSAIQDAEADLAFNLTGMGGPLHPQGESLYGDMRFTLLGGRVMGIDPGFGRILSLLSVTNIQRRLSLDFSDITKKGFVFDRIHGKIQFEKDWATTSDLTLRGPIADIDFNGHVGLSDKHPVQADMVLSPNVTGSMPVAAVIASGGNPVVGAAVWLFNKVSDNQLNSIVQYHYKVTGLWEDPQITEVAIVQQPEPAPLKKGKNLEQSKASDTAPIGAKRPF